MKDREANIPRVIERRSLLPRMIYLSIQSASVSVKENFEVNGSISDPKISSELKFLLDHNAKMLGCSLSDAIEVVLGVSSGLKSSEVRVAWFSDYNHMFPFFWDHLILCVLLNFIATLQIWLGFKVRLWCTVYCGLLFT